MSSDGDASTNDTAPLAHFALVAMPAGSIGERIDGARRACDRAVLLVSERRQRLDDLVDPSTIQAAGQAPDVNEVTHDLTPRMDVRLDPGVQR